MAQFKVLRKKGSGQVLAVAGHDDRNPRPWASETLLWSGEAASEADALEKAKEEGAIKERPDPHLPH